MTEQEEIERNENITKKILFTVIKNTDCNNLLKGFVDFHLAEIDRIVEPLIEFRKENCKSGMGVTIAIDETLNRAKGK